MQIYILNYIIYLKLILHNEGSLLTFLDSYFYISLSFSNFSNFFYFFISF